MMIFIFILLTVLVILTVMCYALCVVAHDADERAERMYRAWKESKDDNSNDGKRNHLER